MIAEPSISCSELLDHLGDEEILVVDCRSEEQWRSEGQHIPGALRVAPAELSDAVDALPEDELIVLCDGTSDSSESRKACRLLRLCGREAVFLKGGFPAWVRGGFPTESHVVSRPRPSIPRAAQQLSR